MSTNKTNFYLCIVEKSIKKLHQRLKERKDQVELSMGQEKQEVSEALKDLLNSLIFLGRNKSVFKKSEAFKDLFNTLNDKRMPLESFAIINFLSKLEDYWGEKDILQSKEIETLKKLLIDIYENTKKYL